MFLLCFGSAPKTNVIIQNSISLCQPFRAFCYKLIVEYDQNHVNSEVTSHELSTLGLYPMGKTTYYLGRCGLMLQSQPYHSPILDLSSKRIFNSAVVPFEDNFAGVFRCDNKELEMNLQRGFHANEIDWQLDETPINWQFSKPEHVRCEHRYDPRVVCLEDRYFIRWCNGYQGPTIELGYD